MLAYHVVGEYTLEVRIGTAYEGCNCAEDGESGVSEETHVQLTSNVRW